jgi:hypothetical protein
MRQVQLEQIELPDFGEPTVQPEIPPEIYLLRVQAALARAQAHQLEALVVYGDREHSANIAYLSGFDPRFEEAVLILAPHRKHTLVVGVEGLGYSGLVTLPCERVLYPPFSLMGMPATSGIRLEAILQAAGLAPGTRIGIVGWKYPEAQGEGRPSGWTTVPSFIIDSLRELAGSRELLIDSTSIFMNPADGLRVINEVEQLAYFEFASTFTSQALRNVLFGVRPGMTEIQAARLMDVNGLPLSAHLMLSSGPRAAFGLPSPSLRVMARGDFVTVAFGQWGALNCRAGFLAERAEELPNAIRDYVDRLVSPYFAAIVEWYERVGIGVTGGELYGIIQQHLGNDFFGVRLTPGHYIHLDEWVHSPMFAKSEIRLRSGMALQVDVIPSTGTSYMTTNIEDGIALADDELRSAFEQRYPEAWQRIQMRRRFMEEALGIRLRPEVLPFSNIPAYLCPFFLSPSHAMVSARN